MADSLGEVFVEVLADASPFGDSLESGIGDALQTVESEISATFDAVENEASQAFSSVSSEADSAASETASAFDGASSEIQESIDGISFDGMLDKARENIGKITVAAGVGGAGLEAFARSQRDVRLDAQNLAAQLGVSEGSMYDLIAATSDATFPLEDVAELMTIAARRGIEGEQGLTDFANFWDMIGDATGESAVDLGRAAVALGQVGIGAGEEGEALDAFGFIMNNTQSSVNDFMRMIGMVGSELGENTPSVNDMAAALKALEDEGFDARRAQSELRRALSATDGDMNEALKTLGVSEDAYRNHADSVAGSGSAIEGNAERFAASRTPIERMTAAVQAQIFQMPLLAEGAAALAGPLAAVGPAAMGFTHGIDAIKLVAGPMGKALGAMRGAFVKLGAVILANPIFLIGALLIGIAVLIWKFRDEIIEALVGAWEWIKDKVGAVFDWFRNAISSVIDWVKENWTLILAIITGPIGLAIRWIIKNWDQLRETFTRIVNRIVDFVRNAFNNLRDTVVNAISSLRQNAIDRMTALVDWVRRLPRMILDALGNVGRLLLDAGKNIIQGLWDGMRQIWDNLTGWVGGLGDRIRNLKGPLSYDRVMLTDIGEAIIGGLGKGMEREWSEIESLLQSFNAEIPLNVSRDSLDGIAGESTAAGSAAGSTVINYTVNNPTPEPASQSLSRDMRKLTAIGLFGG